MMLPTNSSFLIILTVLVLFTSCQKEEDTNGVNYDVPTTYSFENVSYTGQIQRLAMLWELQAYMKSANTAGVTLDANRLRAMYANNTNNAQWTGTYEASKQLKNKTFENEQTIFDDLLGQLALASQSTVAGTEGQAGVVITQDNERQYLLNSNGLELAQVIEKGLMGACLYYQATGVYLETGKMEVDNTIITPGEGTAMEHHWDEAFGYLGVPIDFPTNTDGLVFWGNYCNKRDEMLGTNQKIMDAFLKGRAAISNDDLITRDEAINGVRTQWELVVVGTALHYLNAAANDFDDMALRAHALSEAIAFIYSLQFNPAKLVSNADVSNWFNELAGSSDFDSMNLYSTTVTAILSVRDQLAAQYQLAGQKDDF